MKSDSTLNTDIRSSQIYPIGIETDEITVYFSNEEIAILNQIKKELTIIRSNLEDPEASDLSFCLIDKHAEYKHTIIPAYKDVLDILKLDVKKDPLPFVGFDFNHFHNALPYMSANVKYINSIKDDLTKKSEFESWLLQSATITEKRIVMEKIDQMLDSKSVSSECFSVYHESEFGEVLYSGKTLIGYQYMPKFVWIETTSENNDYLNAFKDMKECGYYTSLNVVNKAELEKTFRKIKKNDFEEIKQLEKIDELYLKTQIGLLTPLQAQMESLLIINNLSKNKSHIFNKTKK